MIPSPRRPLSILLCALAVATGCPRSSEPGAKPTVAGYTPDGARLWMTTFDGGDHIYGQRLAVLPLDGGFAVVGDRQDWTNGPVNIHSVPYFERYDAAGKRELGREVPTVASELRQLVAMPDGSLIMASVERIVEVGADGVPGDEIASFYADRTGNIEGMAALANGDIVVGGGFASTDGNRDLALLRLTRSGDEVWRREVGGADVDTTGGDAIYDLAVAADGSIVVTGAIASSTVFGAGEESETTVDSGNTEAPFVAVFEDDGRLRWVTVLPETVYGRGTALALLEDGSIVVAGNTETLSLFIARFDSDGDQLWRKRVASEGNPALIQAEGLVALREGGVILTGAFEASAVFAEGESGEKVLKSGVDPDAFLARYGAGGELVWAESVGVGDTYDIFHAVTQLDDGTVVVAGSMGPHEDATVATP